MHSGLSSHLMVTFICTRHVEINRIKIVYHVRQYGICLRFVNCQKNKFEISEEFERVLIVRQLLWKKISIMLKGESSTLKGAVVIHQKM